MNFHEVRFPPGLSFGSTGGPERRTDVVTMKSGHEERNTPWADSRRRYDAGLAARSVDDLQEIIAFFEARRGRLYGFRWKDWSDYSSTLPSRVAEFTDQVFATGDGFTPEFQLSKSYSSGEGSYTRAITKPVEGTVKIGNGGQELVEGSDYTIDYKTGVVAFSDIPAEFDELTAGFEFDVPVRFDTDFLDINSAGFEAGDIPSVPVIEVRV